ncbi:MAG TPA: hypothetical protein VGO06_10950 [Bosea sp. (in: a-proteobacteria)]|jgi:hypothetical protein|uniref:hypothetical protein n=1 Tax=Bosea sp. (in: a-proteobacteria) TaxID=1871050 RepID=UPI002E1069A2|nr:hypothetical protein [Bosea sp. (in: a-proteobacteria)]
MTMAQNSEGAAVTEIAPARLNGRVDALDGNRLHGWIWDEARPEERLTVRLVRDGVAVQEVVADQSRVDLRRNGIGDGRHAFAMELDDSVVAARADLVIIGVSPSTGVALELRLPPPAELAAEAAIAVPLARFFDRVEALIVLQRRSQLTQKELLDKVGELGLRLTEYRQREQEAKQSGEAEGQDAIAARLAEIDVFQLRFDQTLKSFDDRLVAIRKEARAPLRQVTVILGFLSGLAALLSFATLAVTLVGG